MDSFAHACDKEDRLITAISDQWKPFIPEWYMQKHYPTSSPVAPKPPTATSTSIITVGKSLTTGMIAGIAIAAIFVVLVILGALFYSYKQRKTIKKKNKEVAILSDQHHPDGGVHKAISELTSGHDVSYNSSPPRDWNPRPLTDSLGTTAVDTWMMSTSKATSPVQPHFYPQATNTAPSSVYDDDLRQTPSEIAHENAGYRPHGSPLAHPHSLTPAPLRLRRQQDVDDETLPVPRHEMGGSPVHSDHSGLSPVKTASHYLAAYTEAGELLGYKRP
jgi:hypothetical protein